MAKRKKNTTTPTTNTTAVENVNGKATASVAAKSVASNTSEMSEPTYNGITDTERELPAQSVTEQPVPSIPSVTAEHTPTREEIARRAYEIAVSRGGAPGHEMEDWLRAEHE